MARKCDICGKKPGVGNNVSRSNKKTKRVFKPNIHKTKVELNSKIKYLNVCTKCLKSNKVKKVV